MSETPNYQQLYEKTRARIVARDAKLAGVPKADSDALAAEHAALKQEHERLIRRLDKLHVKACGHSWDEDCPCRYEGDC